MNTTNERHTPETDALQAQVWKPNWAAHARRLERERDEAREDAQAQARLLGMSGEREAKLLAQLAVERALADIEELERERDEARAIAKYWQEQYGHCKPEHEWQALPWDKEGGPQ